MEPHISAVKKGLKQYIQIYNEMSLTKSVLTFAAATSLYYSAISYFCYVMFAGDGPLYVYLDFPFKHHPFPLMTVTNNVVFPII